MRLAEIISDKDKSWLYLQRIELVKLYDQMELVSDHFTIPADEVYSRRQTLEFINWLNDKKATAFNDAIAQKYINQLLDWLNS
jgi:hypothetical protein